MKLVVFGATGGTGQELVRQALKQGHSVTAFVRSPEKLAIHNASLTVMKGDVLDQAAVEKAVQGQEAVLVALGVKPPSQKTVVGPGTRNILNAMKKHSVGRIIVESAMFMDDGLRSKSLPLRLMTATMMKGPRRDKLIQEKIVMESGLEWVIARPTMLTNGEKSGWRVRDASEVGMSAKISRADVADFMLKQVKDDPYVGRGVLLSG